MSENRREQLVRAKSDSNRNCVPDSPATIATPNPITLGPSAMPRVLIADDNSQNAELLEAHLDGTGWDTKVAVNGDETLEFVKSWQPDVVLLDIMMPKLSGFEVCKAIRADEANASVGILMVTALDQPSDIEKAINAGTDDFLTKPIHKSELLLRVRALIEARKQTNETDRSLTYFRQATVGV